MDPEEIKRNFKNRLSSSPHLFENNENVEKEINRGIVTLSELINGNLITKKIFTNFSDSFLIDIERSPNEFLSINDLFEKKFISEEKKVSLERLVEKKRESEEEEKKRVYLDAIKDGEYTDLKIRSIVHDFDIPITRNDLYSFFREERIAEIMGDPIGPGFQIDMTKLEEELKLLPPLKKDRLDVFVLGVPGSGKSCFMGGLLHYVKKEGCIDNIEMHDSANDYFSDLTEAVKYNRIPPPTPQEYIQHMACSFDSYKKNPKTGQKPVHPFTFIEMSGEIFNQTFTSDKNNMDKKLVEYLFSDNRKVFFFVVSYEAHILKHNTGRSQHDRFMTIFNFLKRNGVLDKTDALCLIVNKWDKCESREEKADTLFLRDEYRNLVNSCLKVTKKGHADYIKGLSFRAMKFSLGDFNDPGDSDKYIYNELFSKNVYQWLCNVSSFENIPAKKGKIGKLFMDKNS
jgi:hypothetical protein